MRSVESLISMDGSGAATDFGGPGDGDDDCGGDLEERSQSHVVCVSGSAVHEFFLLA